MYSSWPNGRVRKTVQRRSRRVGWTLTLSSRHNSGRLQIFAAGLEADDRAGILFGCDPMVGDASVGII